jgi:hypothetical protein
MSYVSSPLSGTRKVLWNQYPLRFFAPGIGMFLEVNPESEEFLQLADCNFDPRCSDLPRP